MAGRRAEGQRTRERIIEAALPLFAEHGFAGTSTRKVAGDAGVNVATLAYHFADKEGLYLTVVQRLHEELAEGWPTRLPPGSPSEVVDWLVGQAWAFVNEHQVHIRLLHRHVLDRGRHSEVIIDRWTEPLMARADGVITLFRPEWSPTERRMLVLSAMHLFIRFAIEDRAQLAVQLGDPEDVDLAVVGWLGDLLRRELGLPVT